MKLDRSGLIVTRDRYDPKSRASIAIWDPATPHRPVIVAELLQGELGIAISSDQRWAACLSHLRDRERDHEETELALIDLRRAEVVSRRRQTKPLLRCATFSPAGSRLAIATDDRVELCDSEGTILSVFEAKAARGTVLEFSFDGTQLFFWPGHGPASLLDVTDLSARWTFGPVEEDSLQARFDGDGRFVVLWGESRKLQLLDGTSGRLLSVAKAEDRILTAALAPDGGELWIVEDSSTSVLFATRRFEIIPAN